MEIAVENMRSGNGAAVEGIEEQLLAAFREDALADRVKRFTRPSPAR